MPTESASASGPVLDSKILGLRKWGCWVLILGSVGSAAVITWMTQTQNFDPLTRLPSGYQSPILAIELARTGPELGEIFVDNQEGGVNREVFRRQIFEDWFFIGAYSITFLGLIGFGYWKTGAGKALALIAVVLIAVAAWHDVRENRGILRAIDTPAAQLTDATARAIRQPSLIKWGAIFSACVLVGLPTLVGATGGPPARGLARLAGTVLVIAGGFGLYAVFLENPRIGIAVGLILLGVTLSLAHAFLFIRGARTQSAPAP